MSVQITAIDKFNKLKQRRDLLSRDLAMFNGRLASSRDRYNDIMRELATFKIGSLDELRAKLVEVNSQIDEQLVKAEEMLLKMEVELRAIDS